MEKMQKELDDQIKASRNEQLDYVIEKAATYKEGAAQANKLNEKMTLQIEAQAQQNLKRDETLERMMEHQTRSQDKFYSSFALMTNIAIGGGPKRRRENYSYEDDPFPMKRPRRGSGCTVTDYTEKDERIDDLEKRLQEATRLIEEQNRR